MRYNSPLPTRPQVGDRYKRRRFAFLPTRMIPDYGAVVWWEHYEEVLEYFPGYMENVNYWRAVARTPLPTKPPRRFL